MAQAGKATATDEAGTAAGQPDKETTPLAGHAAAQGPAVGRYEPATALGHITELMRHSPFHRHLFLADLEWLVVPPIIQRQFRIYRQDNIPFAYVSWARLSQEAQERLRNGNHRLRPDEWNVAGGALWVVDLVAPFGGQENVLGNLKQDVFKGETFRMLQPAPGGKGMAVVER